MRGSLIFQYHNGKENPCFSMVDRRFLWRRWQACDHGVKCFPSVKNENFSYIASLTTYTGVSADCNSVFFGYSKKFLFIDPNSPTRDAYGEFLANYVPSSLSSRVPVGFYLYRKEDCWMVTIVHPDRDWQHIPLSNKVSSDLEFEEFIEKNQERFPEPHNYGTLTNYPDKLKDYLDSCFTYQPYPYDLFFKRHDIFDGVIYKGTYSDLSQRGIASKELLPFFPKEIVNIVLDYFPDDEGHKNFFTRKIGESSSPTFYFFDQSSEENKLYDLLLECGNHQNKKLIDILEGYIQERVKSSKSGVSFHFFNSYTKNEKLDCAKNLKRLLVFFNSLGVYNLQIFLDYLTDPDNAPYSILTSMRSFVELQGAVRSGSLGKALSNFFYEAGNSAHFFGKKITAVDELIAEIEAIDEQVQLSSVKTNLLLKTA